MNQREMGKNQLLSCRSSYSLFLSFFLLPIPIASYSLLSPTSSSGSCRARGWSGLFISGKKTTSSSTVASNVPTEWVASTTTTKKEGEVRARWAPQKKAKKNSIYIKRLSSRIGWNNNNNSNNNATKRRIGLFLYSIYSKNKIK